MKKSKHLMDSYRAGWYRKESVGLAVLLLSLFLFGCGNDSGSGAGGLADGTIVKLSLIQTSDLQNRVTGTAPSITYKTENDQTLGGFARLASKMNAIRDEKKAEETPVLLFDTGNAMTGSLYDLITDETEIPPAFAFFTAMKYNGVMLGGGDFLYGPSTLADMISGLAKDYSGKLPFPLILSTLQTDGLDPSDDDKLEALEEDGIFSKSLILTLDNGLKVGVLSIMGPDGFSEISGALSPAVFLTDYSTIQSRVNTLRSYDPDLVIALMYAKVGLIEDPDSEPPAPGEPLPPKIAVGDGVDIANNIYGVDVFLSGSGKEVTGLIISNDLLKEQKVDETENGATHTYEIKEAYPDAYMSPVVIASGEHGRTLLQLDLTIEVGRGIKKATHTKHIIDSSVLPDEPIDSLVSFMDEELTILLQGKDMPEKNRIAGDADEGLALGAPMVAEESSIGNLIADSYRYAFKPEIDSAPLPPTIGVVGNGMIKTGLLSGVDMTFSDIFNVLPLGDSLDSTQLDRPGYPLIKAWLSGTEVVNLCQFAAYAIGAQDTEFMEMISDRTTEFVDLAVSLANSSNFVKFEADLRAAKENGADYYTKTYAAEAYAALTDDIADPANPLVDCNCPEPFDPPEDPENPKLCNLGDEACNCDDEWDSEYVEGGDCNCADPDWETAAQVYRDGASKLTTLYTFLSGFTADNFINLSGVQFSTESKASLYKVKSENVRYYQNTDYKCAVGPAVDDRFESDTEYPFVTDLFTLLLLTSTDIRYALENIDIPIEPQAENGTPVFEVTAMTFRFDVSPDPAYPTRIHEELKCWQTLFNYIEIGLNGSVTEADYGTPGRIVLPE